MCLFHGEELTLIVSTFSVSFSMRLFYIHYAHPSVYFFSSSSVLLCIYLFVPHLYVCLGHDISLSGGFIPTPLNSFDEEWRKLLQAVTLPPTDLGNCPLSPWIFWSLSLRCDCLHKTEVNLNLSADRMQRGRGNIKRQD